MEQKNGLRNIGLAAAAFVISFAPQDVGGTPEEFARRISADFVKWAKVVKESGVRVD
mgnify:CR=1 FL=1